MKKRCLWEAAAIFAASSLAACGQQEMGSVYAEETAKTRTVPAETDRAQGDFDSAMFSAMAEQKKGSFVFSPYSIKDCLTLAWDGMSGGAKKALEEKGISADTVKDMSAFDRRAESLSCLNVANRLYVNRERAADYNTDLIREDSMEEVPMNPDTAEKINAWIAQETHDRIQNLISSDQITEDTVLIPVNAVWMKLSWRNRFRQEKLSWKEDGSQKEGFSGIIDPTDVRQTQDGYIIRLAYMPEYGNEEDEEEPLRVSMYIFLDRDDDDGSKIERDVKEGKLERQIPEDFSKDYAGLPDCTQVRIHMPQFQAKYKGDVTKMLDDIGLEDILNKEAYEKIGDMAIAGIMHGAFINTDRNGTEAAAATAELAMATSTQMKKPVIRDIAIDHPFAYVIRVDAEGGQVLFEGITKKDALTEITE